MDIFWTIFWVVFWIMIFIGLSGVFFYFIKILRDISIVLKTATSVSEQIQAIADLVEDVRTKASMGVFVDVLELSKRLFIKLKGSKKKH
ncbi:MAG: hypothetical protein WCJ19_00990 [bacterium]